MKVSRLVSALVGVLLGCFAGPTLSYGDRAAAERVLAFSAYVQEEIFDSSQHTIATGCKPREGGGRLGLRGGHRCTFGEFCEHIWKPGPITGIGMPSGVKWDDDITDAKKNDPEALVRKLMGRLEVLTPNPDYDPTYDPKKDPNPKKDKTKMTKDFKTKVPASGFTGNADADKIGLPPGKEPNPNVIQRYYDALEHCGSRMLDAKAEFDAHPDRLSAADKTTFGNWVNTGRKGADLLYQLRLQDKWQAMYSAAGDLDGKMGVKTVTNPGESSFDYLKGKTWKEMDVPKTIQLFPGDNDEEKRAAFERKFAEIDFTDDKGEDSRYRKHQTALLAVQRIKIQLAGCIYIPAKP